MNEYKYVEVNYNAKGVVFSCIDEYHHILEEYAKNGYDYVGFLPTEISANGCLRKIDLIFKK